MLFGDLVSCHCNLAADETLLEPTRQMGQDDGMKRQAALTLAASVFLGALTSIPLISAGPSAAQDRPLRMDSAGNPIPDSLPSFDCSVASTFVERLICRDPSVGRADRSLAEIYSILLRRSGAQDRAALQREQRQWLARRDACRNAACLLPLYEQRTQALVAVQERRDAALRARLSRIGQCETTRIDWIGARLEEVEGEPPMGTSVGVANGVGQVSYDRERAVLTSRLGDPVRVCLRSIPRDCPRGDYRGRIYDVTNLRTGARWRLPDSQHSCGGA